MLALPGGLLIYGVEGEASVASNWQFALHLFHRSAIQTGTAPTASIPTFDSPCVGVRFHPNRWSPSASSSVSPSFYVFAVICVHFVAVYSSAKSSPIAVSSDLHFTAMLDCAWGPDFLVVVSSDGFASVLRWTEEEIGGMVMLSGEVVESSGIHQQENEIEGDQMDGLEVLKDVPAVLNDVQIKRRKITPVIVQAATEN